MEIYATNDADAFAALLTDDFLYTSPLGEVVPRATYLQNLRERSVLMRAVVPTDERVRMYGETAIFTATWTVDESYRGARFKGPVRITRVWVRDGGEWRAAAFQVTNVKLNAR